ncbi:hypothetical protein RQP46_005888 [Phenoliferia psychrophenolica]
MGFAYPESPQRFLPNENRRRVSLPCTPPAAVPDFASFHRVGAITTATAHSQSPPPSPSRASSHQQPEPPTPKSSSWHTGRKLLKRRNSSLPSYDENAKRINVALVCAAAFFGGLLLFVIFSTNDPEPVKPYKKAVWVASPSPNIGNEAARRDGHGTYRGSTTEKGERQWGERVPYRGDDRKVVRRAAPVRLDSIATDGDAVRNRRDNAPPAPRRRAPPREPSRADPESFHRRTTPPPPQVVVIEVEEREEEPVVEEERQEEEETVASADVDEDTSDDAAATVDDGPSEEAQEWRAEQETTSSTPESEEEVDSSEPEPQDPPPPPPPVVFQEAPPPPSDYDVHLAAQERHKQHADTERKHRAKLARKDGAPLPGGRPASGNDRTRMRQLARGRVGPRAPLDSSNVADPRVSGIDPRSLKRRLMKPTKEVDNGLGEDTRKRVTPRGGTTPPGPLVVDAPPPVPVRVAAPAKRGRKAGSKSTRGPKRVFVPAEGDEEDEAAAKAELAAAAQEAATQKIEAEWGSDESNEDDGDE